jgi:dTDP-4-dehydrorhamnose reductase
VRTAWLYDRIRGFVPRIIDKAREGGDIEVVVDQMGQPTSADDLADQIVQLAQHAHDGTAPAGIYHATSTGGATKYQLACEALKLVGLDPDIIMPVTSARFYGAPRAAYSILGHDKWRTIGMDPIPHWTLGLRQCLQGS